MKKETTDVESELELSPMHPDAIRTDLINCDSDAVKTTLFTTLENIDTNLPSNLSNIIEEHLINAGSQTDFNGSSMSDGLYREWFNTEDLDRVQFLALDGEWERLVDPKTHDVIQIDQEFVSDDTNILVTLRPGLRAYIIKVDQDGDMNIFAPGLIDHGLPQRFAYQWICQSNFKNMSRRRLPIDVLPKQA